MALWPQSVVQEVAERRAVFVIGAGASMAAQDGTGRRPPSWAELLKSLSDGLGDSREKRYALSLIKKKQYLEAAQIIQDGVPPAEFAAVINSSLKTRDFQPSRIHKAILNMDPKVVVTTNYDEIYEEQFNSGSGGNGHVVCRYYDHHFINDLRSGQRCIFKIHGCVTDPSQVVLSKTTYFTSRRNYRQFFSAIDALFLVSTLIFVATSFEDPDLQLILENNNISAPSSHHHYIITEKVRHPSQKRILQTNYNIHAMEYKKGNHDQVAEFLEELSGEVLRWRATHD